MRKKIWVGIACAILVCIGANAQTLSVDQDELIWKTSGYRNLITGEQANEEGVFQTTLIAIIWTHNAGKTTETLSVSTKQDSWPDVTEDGSVIYSVTWKNIPGKIRFRKSNGQTMITTEFIDKNINTAPYEFVVSGVIRRN